jgi:hypothetical protein
MWTFSPFGGGSSVPKEPPLGTDLQVTETNDKLLETSCWNLSIVYDGLNNRALWANDD